jgi:hypothetical protein
MSQVLSPSRRAGELILKIVLNYTAVSERCQDVCDDFLTVFLPPRGPLLPAPFLACFPA